MPLIDDEFGFLADALREFSRLAAESGNPSLIRKARIASSLIERPWITADELRPFLPAHWVVRRARTRKPYYDRAGNLCTQILPRELHDAERRALEARAA